MFLCLCGDPDISVRHERKDYLVKEVATQLRTGENVVRNLIKDGRIRAMKMPTLIIPDFELERFITEMVESQEDLSRYADKKFLIEEK